MTTPVESTGIGTERTAAEALGLLSEETRLDILRTVAEAQNESQRRDTAEVTFSEIYDRVDVDGTSKLSYHLGELTGTFLRKHGNGDRFTHAGEQKVRFILAENYRQPPDVGPVEADGACLRCGSTSTSALWSPGPNGYEAETSAAAPESLARKGPRRGTVGCARN